MKGGSDESHISRRSALKAAVGFFAGATAAVLGYERYDDGRSGDGTGGPTPSMGTTGSNNSPTRTAVTGMPNPGSSTPTQTRVQGGAINIVEDFDADPAGNKPVTGAIEDAIAPGATIEFPEGTYQLAGQQIEITAPDVEFRGLGDVTWKFAEGYHGPFIWCERDNFTFRGIDVDMGGSAWESGHMRIVVPSKFLVEDVEFIGRGQGPGYAFQTSVTDENGEGILRNVRVPHGSRPDVYESSTSGKNGNGRIGVYSGGTHEGVLRIENCEFSEFGNNGIYASRTNGDVRVEDSYFLNNGVSGIRLSGEESWAKRCTVEIDTSKYDGPPLQQNWGTWGIICENRRADKTLAAYPARDAGMLVEDCEVLVLNINETGQVGAGIKLGSGGRSLTVRDSHVRLDTDRGFGRSTYAVLRVNPYLENRKYRKDKVAPPEPHSLTLDNVRITGSASGGSGVRITRGDGSTIARCTVEQSGSDRAGIRLLYSADCVIDGGSVTTTGYPLVVDTKTRDDCLFKIQDVPDLVSTGDSDGSILSSELALPDSQLLDAAPDYVTQCVSIKEGTSQDSNQGKITFRISKIDADRFYGQIVQ